jgi:release factor glutamine methyltransferase
MKESPLYRELSARLESDAQFLPDKPEENVHSTLQALWHAASGSACSSERAVTSQLRELNASQQATLREMVDRRIGGVPLSHLTGRQQFMGLEMLAGPQALVPRAETELLARIAIGLATAGSAPLLVIDVCTGSGNVALAIAHHVARARVHAADLSEEAVELARRNASHLGLATRVEFRAGDLLAPFDTPEFAGAVDLLTCNPPYISSAKVKQMPGEISGHEPSLAFDGGPFGVSILMRLLNDAPRLLRGGGWLAFEVGLGQGPAMAKRLKGNPAFDEVHSHSDAKGDVRAIAARRAT